jgi:Rrf2 family protein
MSGSSRFAVGVHVLAYLAHKAGQAVTSAEIASSVDTNPVVIRRLLSSFVKVRLVKATKGAHGGFSLASDPANITLLDIYRAVDAPTDHGLARFTPNLKCPVGTRIGGILQSTFFKAQASLEAEFAQTSLKDVHSQLKSVCTEKH